ncbi:MAG: ABC-2 family transporter protein [bacterium]
MRYLRLYLKFLEMSLKGELEYRFNFLVGFLVEIGWMGALIVFYKVIFLNTGFLAGWSYGEALVFLGVVQVFSELFYSIFVIFNLRRLSEYVQKGTLDLYLLKPVNTQFFVSVSNPYTRGLLTIFLGITLAVLGFRNLHLVPGLDDVLMGTLLLFCGVLLTYAISFSSLMVVFWTNRAFNATQIFESLVNTSNYPIDFFHGAVKIVFTFIMPLAFMTTFPAKALLGQTVWWWLPVAILMAGLSLWASSKLWQFALKHYSGASA